MVEVLQEVIQILTGGITGLATSIGSGLNSMVTSVFLVTGENGAQTLSTFGGVIALFFGIGLAVGLTTLITKWVMSFGGRR